MPDNITIPDSSDSSNPDNNSGITNPDGSSADTTPSGEPVSDSTGGLRISATSFRTNRPINNAEVRIQYTDNGADSFDTLTTDENGFTGTLGLPTPALRYSLNPSDVRPYSLVNIRISHPEFESVTINGAQLLPDVTANQSFVLAPLTSGGQESTEQFDIGPNVLYGNYPPSIPESEIKPLNETGEVVLDSVVIPEFIIVHDGPPSSAATDYWVRYTDYIKNVASSEIYANWPEAAIYANILAIQSFTLNRVYTEFYRNKGYNFTITSSTAYDHKWIPERNTFDTIDRCVDEIFRNYLSRPGIKQPILTQYCDGRKVSCPDVMTQWGSKELADRGYSYIEILKYYYGDSIYVNTASQVSGVPSSYPGEILTIGSSGTSVRTIQNQLNEISDAYPALPKVNVDGIFGSKTAEAVRSFQSLFGLTPDGVVGAATWYKISQLYVGVRRLSEYS